MLKVKKSGFFTSIQDNGRYGFRHLGVPVSGAMDKASAKLANAMLENEEDTAVLEITMSGPILEFTKDTWVAITGAHFSPQLNGVDIDNHSTFRVVAGDQLTFGGHVDGLRAYIAVKGGFKTAKVLNSRSFYLPLTEKDHLLAGMEVPYDETLSFEPKIINVIPEEIERILTLRSSPAPEFDLLNDEQKELLFNQPFTIAKENNRMAYQLQELVGEHQNAMLTSATLPGTVQLTPGGKLIILMRDGQTTGGYPRILQLSEESINYLAQRAYGDKVQFKLEA
ncbi:biotin-dependent carboxyltransferase family protein [Muriicola soli]|uniref:Biotin-dependent carboxyltransferase n=1 Tax=Muriicola soli TaxID=2507538 RepID=A0A411E8V5_9FLAO|nr:biotin-dependent carboxyltransferase family protein [Muriicola soli]QBA64078.1 biotin-dependent carboxyltransferase [Muriicola soli]